MVIQRHYLKVLKTVVQNCKCKAPGKNQTHSDYNSLWEFLD